MLRTLIIVLAIVAVLLVGARPLNNSLRELHAASRTVIPIVMRRTARPREMRDFSESFQDHQKGGFVSNMSKSGPNDHPPNSAFL